MKLSHLAPLVLSSAPLLAHSWMLDAPPLVFYERSPSAAVVIQSPSSFLERQEALVDSMLRLTDRLFQDMELSSPRSEVKDDESKFQLSVDFPGAKLENIDIQVDDDGGCLTVHGQSVASIENSKFTSEFLEVFSLDPTVEVDKIDATLENGVLTVTAPKDSTKKST
jgi:HSP20 family protein